MGISLPSFFLGALLMRVFSIELGWLPLMGLRDATQILTGWPAFVDLCKHLVLPMITLVILSIGGMMRYTRTNMLEVMNSEYIRTARAKGLSEHTVIYKHAFRNTLIPLVTMVAGIIPSLFGGAMIDRPSCRRAGKSARRSDAGAWLFSSVRRKNNQDISSRRTPSTSNAPRTPRWSG